MTRGRIAANATKTKWEGQTRSLRELARDLLDVLAQNENLEIVLWDALTDLDALAEMWDRAAVENADRVHGPDIVRASDVAKVCAERVRDIATATRERLAEMEDN